MEAFYLQREEEVMGGDGGKDRNGELEEWEGSREYVSVGC